MKTLFLPDKTDFIEIPISIIITLLIQNMFFSVDNIKLTLGEHFLHTSFLSFLGLIYLSYWGWRWGHSSLYIAIAGAEKRMRLLAKAEFHEKKDTMIPVIQFFGLIFVIFIFSVSFIIRLIQSIS